MKYYYILVIFVITLLVEFLKVCKNFLRVHKPYNLHSKIKVKLNDLFPYMYLQIEIRNDLIK